MSDRGRPTRGRGVVGAVIVLTVVVVSVSCTSAPSSVEADGSGGLPVTYNILPWLRALASDPTASPPGANDFDCVPSEAHPRPVVLVHGLIATRAYWQTLSPLLRNEGYCVFALTYGAMPGQPWNGGLRNIEDSSAELAVFVDEVLAATGASKVDLVGHSEGTVMPQHYLKFRGGASKVDKYVALGPLYQGTTFHGFVEIYRTLERWSGQLGTPLTATLDQQCGACRQLIAGSAFLDELYADGVYAVPGVTYTTIMSSLDELITPYTVGMLDAPNATNIVLQDGCQADQAEHGAVAWTPRAARYVLNALDPAHAQPAPCVPTIYGIGVL